MNSHSEQANPQKPGIHRWYDQDIHLSELVRTMELLSEESQILFALLLASFCDEVVRLKGRSFFKEMDWNKLKGLSPKPGAVGMMTRRCCMWPSTSYIP